MNIPESAARHPWEPQAGTTAWELNEKLSELYKRVARLRGGLRCNFPELDLTLHKLRGEVLEEIVRTATEPLFDEAELRALALIDECYALALALGAGAKPRADDFRKSMRLFVFQAARLRSGDPSTARGVSPGERHSG